MKLNLGCGKDVREGYVNVDQCEAADVCCDLMDYDTSQESCEEILILHALEHLSKSDGRILLERCCRWLTETGILIVEMPERDKCLRLSRSPLLEECINGLKGLVGGVHTNKDQWNGRLIQYRGLLIQRAHSGQSCYKLLPSDWFKPGEPHLCVWQHHEFMKELQGAGFSYVWADLPRTHGQRVYRDTRFLAVKSIHGWRDEIGRAKKRCDSYKKQHKRLEADKLRAITAFREWGREHGAEG